MKDKITSVRFIENENPNRNSSGGIMSYIINLSCFYKTHGIKVSLIGAGPKDSTSLINKTFDFLTISKDNNISNYLFFIKLFFSEVIKEIKSDEIIHVQRPEMVIPLRLRTRNKIICTLHGGQDIAVYQKKGLLSGFIYSILLIIGFLLADYLIAVDKRNYGRFIKKYSWIKKKCSIVPIGVNTDIFHPMDKIKLRKIYGINENEKIILFIGRLAAEKNIEFLIDCFNSIQDHTNYTLMIIGEGPLKKELEERSNPKSKIKFLGEISNNKIVEYLNIADVLALTSKYEGSPTIVKEAICCNLPIIATDVGDVKDLLELVSGGVIIEPTISCFINGLKTILSKEFFNKSERNNVFNHINMGYKTLSIMEQLS